MWSLSVGLTLIEQLVKLELGDKSFGFGLGLWLCRHSSGDLLWHEDYEKKQHWSCSIVIVQMVRHRLVESAPLMSRNPAL
jgi:hypothetical protein